MVETTLVCLSYRSCQSQCFGSTSYSNVTFAAAGAKCGHPMHVGGRPQRGWAGSVRTGSGRRLVTARAQSERSGHAYWRHHCHRKMSQAVGCHPKEYSKRLACVPDLSVGCIMRIACNARSLHSGSFGQGNYRADGNSHVRQTYRYAVRDVSVGSNLQVLGATRQACV